MSAGVSSPAFVPGRTQGAEGEVCQDFCFRTPLSPNIKHFKCWCGSVAFWFPAKSRYCQPLMEESMVAYVPVVSFRLLRNRVSAQQAREKKKILLAQLEAKVADLESRNASLDEEAAMLVQVGQRLWLTLFSCG